ncbi:MAG: N-acetylmuramoyl-L-alanine amidase [Bacteroidaceae bacterium]
MKKGKFAIRGLWALVCLVLVGLPTTGRAKDFTVVIDAGHGGHDPGAVGKTAKEKNINLNVALRLGKKIEERCSDVRVVYTRRKDVFVPLDKRADMANEAKADLFISIHTNAATKGSTARGTETYTLGLARSEANLEVAKRENAVILIEEDYKQRYAGFNPNSAESYIMFEFMQDKHMGQSVSLARQIQSQFRSYAKRTDRGVHQAGFLVLRATTMPSVLIELGYISTPEEERFLSSNEGAEKLAEGICRAFCAYKKAHEKPMLAAGKDSTDEAPAPTDAAQASDKEERTDGARPKPEENTGGAPVFKVQILVSTKPLKQGAPQLKGLTDVDCYQEKGLYKYTCGASTDYNHILRMKKKVADRFADAFVVAFRRGEKMDVNEAIAEFKKKK